MAVQRSPLRKECDERQVERDEDAQRQVDRSHAQADKFLLKPQLLRCVRDDEHNERSQHSTPLESHGQRRADRENNVWRVDFEPSQHARQGRAIENEEEGTRRDNGGHYSKMRRVMVDRRDRSA